MKSRRLLSQGASVLLALGPVLSGAADGGWAMALVFLALFGLAEACLRPNPAPSPGRGGWGLRLLGVGLQGGLLLALILALFGLGRGIAVLAGGAFDLPHWLPPSLSFLALPIFRFSFGLGRRAALS